MHDENIDTPQRSGPGVREPAQGDTSPLNDRAGARCPPSYFHRVRQEATSCWEQLESNKQLAGPWHQLFRQVQSPRHVLSELLQNADDAEATEASVRIADGVFVFEHNGGDFAEEHFDSLCRFGYSNKRALHTIGFRGIGFKSTFSLGDTVELRTPTLSVAFDRKRFTEPRWTDAGAASNGLTEVRVGIRDQHRCREVEKNLEEWVRSPVSLLFFRHIRRLRVGETEISWTPLEPGPVPDSEWMALSGSEEDRYLLLRSPEEPFPDEALTEIRDERMLSIEEQTDFPPCRIEIVLGMKGRLFVVLPTGVETALPFACNAPFIQDPARLKIKDPETSPTNRWLLARAGRLAATAMLAWLQRTDIEPPERAAAYALFPDVDRDDSSLQGVCGAIAEKVFEETIAETDFLLTESGDLKPWGHAVVLPEPVLKVWPAEQASALFDETARAPLSRVVRPEDRARLVHWGTVKEILRDRILLALKNRHLPKPGRWSQLLELWAYVEPDISVSYYGKRNTDLRIVPARGKNVLYAADEVVRLGEGKLLQSDDDWEFLAGHLLVLDQNWPRFLAKRRREAQECDDDRLRDAVEAAHGVLNDIGLEEASDVSKVVDQVAASFFAQERITLADCVRLAQIAAKLGAATGAGFRFVTRDRLIRPVSHTILADEDGALEELFPEDWCESHLLHSDYFGVFSACSKEEWTRWLSSGRSGLLAFAPLVQKRRHLHGRPALEHELRSRGFQGTTFFPFVTTSFLIEDWDFEDAHWDHWRSLAEKDPDLWGRVAGHIIAQSDSFWAKAKAARPLQIATTGNTRPITHEPLLPGWILKLRDLPCLPDTKGRHREPAELLRRTPETESLLDVEPFVHALIDNEKTRPLLILLGVRDTPTGPGALLDRLRALALAPEPPAYEVEKWYRRLDHMLDAASTEDVRTVKQAFAREKLILTSTGGWARADEVFLASDEDDVPGAALVLGSVRDLSLWRRLGVAERPTADLAMKWLAGLPSGEALSPDELRRVRALLPRYPERIWNDCGHWLSLANTWIPVEDLDYALTMQSLVPWSHLHEWVKQATADLQHLPSEVCRKHPFSRLPELAGQIEDRFDQPPAPVSRLQLPSWLKCFGSDLCRVVLEDEQETLRVRALAADLATTSWQKTPRLEIIPYIDGTPAGTPRRADALWRERVLYVEDRPPVRLVRAVVQELDRYFRRKDIADALRFCFDRPPGFVTEYLEDSFTLIPREELEQAGSRDGDEAPAPTKEGREPDEGDDVSQIMAARTVVDEPAALQQAGENMFEEIPPESEDDEQADASGSDPTPALRPRPQKPAQPSLIERFAQSRGYRKDGDGSFFHADGSRIARAVDGSFPWERRAASGDLIRYYLPKSHCLEREPLEIEAHIWGMIDNSPDLYSLILTDFQGKPQEFSGDRLKSMRADGEITLHPAAYRLVYRNDGTKS